MPPFGPTLIFMVEGMNDPALPVDVFSTVDPSKLMEEPVDDTNLAAVFILSLAPGAITILPVPTVTARPPAKFTVPSSILIPPAVCADPIVTTKLLTASLLAENTAYLPEVQ